MLDFLYGEEGTLSAAGIIISIAVMLFLGFAMTRLTKLLRLPNVTAYIVTGILIGPYGLHMVPEEFVAGADFLADIALAFIAFSVGEYFELSTLKKSGAKAAVVTVCEACIASLFIFVLTYWVLRLPLAFSIVLAALASATAPASTMMTIRQTGARGDFVDTLLQVVAMDDVVGLVSYSIAISVAVASLSGGSADPVQTIVKPLSCNLLAMLLGGIFGVVLKVLMPQKRSTDNRLIIALSVLFLFCGLCALLDVSPLLGCMMMGTVYINVAKDGKLFKQLNYFSPPILLLFFVRSGVSFDLNALTGSGTFGSVSLLTVGVLYFFVRIAGKYVGAFLGCLLVGKKKEVRNYLGLALIPQAGVAIGLAALCVRTLGKEAGGSLQTVILASSVLYELIGPACAKLSLYLSHSYPALPEEDAATPADPALPEPSPVEQLIAQLQQIQTELPPHPAREIEDEEAFLQAAEEQYEAVGDLRRGHFLNRRFL